MSCDSAWRGRAADPPAGHQFDGHQHRNGLRGQQADEHQKLRRAGNADGLAITIRFLGGQTRKTRTLPRA